MTEIQAILLFSLFATLAGVAGVAALALWPQGARRASGLLEAAAGGALLVMGAAYLAPEALHLSDHGWIAVAAGIVLGAALQRGAALMAGAAAGALTLLSGLMLHSLLDGAAFTVSLAADPAFAAGGAAGLVLHDAPKALFAFVLLRRAGVGVRGAAAGAVGVAGGLSALGAFAALPAIGALHLPALGAAIGLAGGLLIYSGAACLFESLKGPVLSGGRGKAVGSRAAAAVLAGAAAGWIGQFGHHDHGHGPHGDPHDHIHITADRG